MLEFSTNQFLSLGSSFELIDLYVWGHYLAERDGQQDSGFQGMV